MKICKKCNKEFEEQKGLKNFCSMSCRNFRIMSEESKQKRSQISYQNWHSRTPEQKQIWLENIRKSQYRSRTPEARAKVIKTLKNKTAKKSFDEVGWDTKRIRVIEEQGGKCSKCGNSHWMGIKLSLELDHIDGIRGHDNRANLEALCPNCHSITPTWRGRNKPIRNGENIVTDEQLTELLAEHKNIRQALLSAGLAAKGNNYKRAKQLLEQI